MKKLIYFISIVSLFLSCNSLDLSPEDYYGSSNFWKNTSQVQGFMIGLHSDLRGSYTSMFILGEARGGTSKTGTSSVNVSIDYSSPIKNNAFTKDQTGISSWNGYYGRIFEVNLFIKKVEEECEFLTGKERGYFLGQAYGIRAYYYFMLYRTFGGVPLITQPTVANGVTASDVNNLYTPRSTAKQTMDLIKSDIGKSMENFEKAEASFKIDGNGAMWSKGASLILKAEIYLWSAKVTTQDQKPGTDDLKTAKEALVALEGKFGLMPNFKDVFDVTKKGNMETIFAFRFVDGEAENWAGNFYSSDNVFIGQVYGRDGEKIIKDTMNMKNRGIHRNEYKFELFESFDPDDTRRDATFLDFYQKIENGKVINGGTLLIKAIGTINNLGNRVFSSDIPLYRYSEVLLLRAEVENMQGNDPSSYINEVRKRAYGENYEDHKYTNSSFAENELAILHERDKEFVWEGKRWFDVCRMHDASHQALVFSATANYGSSSPILNKEKEAYKVLWPVDVNTLNNDPKLKQTEGYTD